ncbi:MAG: dockerin type I repeat-containing protein, partial [Candidatus Zixiibacteriota bacterium]
GSANVSVLLNFTFREVVVTSGPDTSEAARTHVVVQFYIENTGDVLDIYDVDVSDSLGWNIDLLHYEVTLDTGEVDSVSFTVSVPNVPVGTTNRVFVTATSQADPSILDSASLTVTCDAYTVQIAEISDVGNDQGKQVRIDWSSFPGSDPLVTHFTLFRRIDSLLFAPLSFGPMIFSAKDYPPGNWEMVGMYPAYGETLYSATIPTLKDSTIAEGMYWSVFFTRAGTDDPLVFFDSPVDSGYSLDNLSPSPPAGLLASHEPAVTKLTWGAIPDVDFDYFTVYRDTSSGFTPDPSNRLGFTTDTSFVDSTAELGKTLYYLVCATDFSGNESDPSNEAMGVRYVTGDASGDGTIDVGDVVFVVNYLYRDGDPPYPVEAGDANCDGIVNVGDVIYLVNYLYRGGDPPGC